jgi:hypothetical protein
MCFLLLRKKEERVFFGGLKSNWSGIDSRCFSSPVPSREENGVLLLRTHTPPIVPSRNLIFFFFLLVLQNGSTSSREIRSCFCQPKKIQERSFYLWLKVGGPPNANNWRKAIHAGRLGAWDSSKVFCCLPRQDLSRERRESKGGENKRQYGWQMIMTKELRRRRSHQRDESRALSHH